MKHTTPRNLSLLLALTFALTVPMSPPSSTQAQGVERAFPETGKTVKGTFLQYWDANGGLAQQGYPISDEMQEKSDIDGKTYTVQYFERAVFEAHPENPSPYDVLLSLLGTLLYKERYPLGAPDQIPNNQPDSVLFAETGHRLGGSFLLYWQQHGGVAQQGYPISDEFREVSALDGKPYTVQYFERAVFELHPENTGTPYEVLLSQLGTFRYRAKFAAPPTPAASTPSPIPTLIPTPTSVPQEASAYLKDALDYIQENSVVGNNNHIDWEALRDKALALAQNAQTAADTYPAISFVLQSIGDGHSRFINPEDAKKLEQSDTEGIGLTVAYAERKVTAVSPESRAETVGVHVGDIVEAINGTAVSSLSASDFFAALYGGRGVTLRVDHEGQAQPVTITINHTLFDPKLVPDGRRLAGSIGYIALPALGSGEIAAQYAGIVQQIIRDIDQTAVCGWVVDLQPDWGGDMYPMLAGIGPVLGEGVAGTFIPAKGDKITWAYQNGAALYGDETVTTADTIYHLKQPSPPVALLTSTDTASAGEAIAVSFGGRLDTRSFGSPTYGVPSANSVRKLSDGAWLVLTTSLEADRTGRIYAYNEKIAPDQAVAGNPSLIGTDNDPVLQAATGWLNGQSGCSR